MLSTPSVFKVDKDKGKYKLCFKLDKDNVKYTQYFQGGKGLGEVQLVFQVG